MLRSAIAKQLVNRSLRLYSQRGSRFIASRFGREVGFVYVGGYPKSGTTWMSQLVAHYLGIPAVENSLLPIGHKCVLHQHWDYEPALDREIYVVRDGRDVMVSLYHSLMKGVIAFREKMTSYGRLSRVERALVERLEWAPRNERRFREVLGPSFEPWDVRANLPRFIEAELTDPILPVVTKPWHAHVQSWRESGRDTVFVRYEDLLADPRGTLHRVFVQYLGTEPDDELIELAVDRCSFERQTGRKRGVEDRKQFARKGIAGDWQNHFTAEARQVFHRMAGETLVTLGYVEDDAWVRDAA